MPAEPGVVRLVPNRGVFAAPDRRTPPSPKILRAGLIGLPGKLLAAPVGAMLFE